MREKESEREKRVREREKERERERERVCMKGRLPEGQHLRQANRKTNYNC